MNYVIGFHKDYPEGFIRMDSDFRFRWNNTYLHAGQPVKVLPNTVLFDGDYWLKFDGGRYLWIDSRLIPEEYKVLRALL